MNAARDTVFPVTMNLEEIRALVQTDLESVNRVIRARLKSAVPLVDQIADHIIAGGGKRLRPLLVVLVGRACGHEGDAVVEAAAFIEFIHTATLLHDDVVDGSSMRRGRDTANEVFGNQASVLVGDFVYSRAFQMMAALTSQRVMEMLAGGTITVQQALAAYGKHLGTAYQLMDDVLDYRSNPAERGKNLGDDLAEGKPTLPLIHALRHGNESQQAAIRLAVANGGLAQLDPIVAAIESTGGLEYAARLAQGESERALKALDALPDSPYRTGLA